MSFFTHEEASSKQVLPTLVPRCGACGLYKGCLSPKMPVTGAGRRGILVVAEAPGADEDKEGVQLVGQAGQYLRSVLMKFDIDLDRDCWKTNALSCRPPDNRPPTKDEIDYCRPLVLKAIRELQPSTILVLGGVAVRSVIAPFWRENTDSITTWAGWKIPLQEINAWVCPTYHPSHIKRSESEREGAVRQLWFERHIEAAVALRGRPWDVKPDYASQVRILKDPDTIERWIRDKIASGGPVAFDYETDRIKPDHPDSWLVSCSICWKGKETIAFPMLPQLKGVMRDFLTSDLPKIGANTKFESRWSQAKFGVLVNNWRWDTMLSAHHLDCRDGITSVKFQGFVRLGIEDWSAKIKPYLEDVKPDGSNRIGELDLDKLLIYNGIDSIVEFALAGKQRLEMEVGVV